MTAPSAEGLHVEDKGNVLGDNYSITSAMHQHLLKKVDSSLFEKNWFVTCHVFVGSGSSSNSIDDPSTTDDDLMLRSFPGEEISINRFLWSTL